MKQLLKFTLLFIFLLPTNISYADDIKGFVGEWRGEVVERRKARKIELVFWTDKSGKLKGVTYYPEFKCAGRLRYDGIDRKGKRILSEVIFTLSPKCMSGGRIEFALTPGNKITWHWDAGSDSARGVLQKHKVSADTMQFALDEKAGKPTAADHAYNKSAGNTGPVVKNTVKHKTRITSPAGYYLVTDQAINKIKIVRYDKKKNAYIIDFHLVAGTGSLFHVGERTAHATWYLSSQQLHVSNFAKVPGLQRCNFWTKLHWTYAYEQVQPNVWKEVNKYGAGRTPSNFCSEIRIDNYSCKWTCKRRPPAPKPDSYLVKDLAQAKSIYSKIVKAPATRQSAQQNNSTRSSGKDHWQEYWDNKVKDARQNVIDNW